MTMYELYTDILNKTKTKLSDNSGVAYHTLIKYTSKERTPPDSHLKAIKRVIQRELELQIRFHEKKAVNLSKYRDVIDGSIKCL